MDELFPTALIDTVTITRLDRVLKDEFESGGIASRRLWPAGYFRRKLTVQTTPLTWEEFRHLRSYFDLGTCGGSFFEFESDLVRGGVALFGE